MNVLIPYTCTNLENDFMISQRLLYSRKQLGSNSCLIIPMLEECVRIQTSEFFCSEREELLVRILLLLANIETCDLSAKSH
jgi:hypothetical protein